MADGSTDTETGEIDVKRAISIAKAYAREVFGEELESPPTLEEVWYDETRGEWLVTVGIRHRHEMRLGPAGREMRQYADYKTVRVSAKDGKPLSIKLHDSAA